MTHNLQPFKPITYNPSSEKPGFKVCLSSTQPAALHSGGSSGGGGGGGIGGGSGSGGGIGSGGGGGKMPCRYMRVNHRRTRVAEVVVHGGREGRFA
jgi:hypothetical protein